ncbi:restriction endonuclease [Vibrio crassostreae]|uniref:restriction endonuclease n=1 Tax=Vibrio crassostreae TaxID=246167 RepID=UPI00148BDD75|nr:restriction endonuclease [Vibrio crassostreae]NOI54725.1 restriction endonuclease [Vibrio crassostreae]
MKLEHLKDETKYPEVADKRRRGYEFENYLFDAFEADGISVKKPFKCPGEQIDGGIYFDGAWYLIEAKWHSKKLPVSDVYSFKGKVDGKLSGTKGLFISWSGYSNECSDALSLGKDLNVILFDSSDIEVADKVGWKKVITDKLMFASLYGQVYASSSLLESLNNAEKSQNRYEIFVEGQFDMDILSMVTGDYSNNVSYIPCNGKLNAIRMASTLPKQNGIKRILILDSDGNPNLEEELSRLSLVDKLFVIEPSIEGLFFPDSDSPHTDLRVEARKRKLSTSILMQLMLPFVIKENPQGFVSSLIAEVSS